jgi:glucokinase
MTAKLFIGIDIGGGSAKIGLVNSQGAIVGRHRIPVKHGEDAPQILNSYNSAIDTLMRDANAAQLGGIGVGFPGHILPDFATGANSNVPALDGVPIADILARRFGCPSRMVNDADAGAMAEYRFGAGRGVDRLLLVTVGTGIGVSLLATQATFCLCPRTR